MDVTVTIVNWNRADLLEHCLQSVLGSGGSLEIEVIVIDNASTDNTLIMVREQFPSVRLIANTENVGFGRAHNQALAEANGRYLLILNNDAAVFPDTIAALAQFMDDHPRAGICTCPARSREQRALMTGGGVKYFPSVVQNAIAGLIELVKPPFGCADLLATKLIKKVNGQCSPIEERQVAWAGGALLLVRRAMLDQVGHFDARFFMYFEETDLCLRAQKSGWTVWQTSGTCYLHEGGMSTALRTDRETIWTASGRAYFQKNKGSLHAALWNMQNYLIRRLLLGARRKLARRVRDQLKARWPATLSARICSYDDKRQAATSSCSSDRDWAAKACEDRGGPSEF
jgi:hypothetical protein